MSISRMKRCSAIESASATERTATKLCPSLPWYTFAWPPSAENSPTLAGPVNLGNPSEFSMLELAQKIISLTGSGSKIVYKQLPQDDPVQRQPDIEKARKLMNWAPAVSLDEGLLKTIEYFDKLLAARRAREVAGLSI